MWPRASSWWQFTSVQDGTIRAWESHMKSEAWPARDLQMTWNSLSFDENHRGSKHTVIQEPTSWQPNLNDPDISSVVPFLFFFFCPWKILHIKTYMLVVSSAYPTDWHPLLFGCQIVQRSTKLAVGVLKGIIHNYLVEVAVVDTFNLLALLYRLNEIFLLYKRILKIWQLQTQK